MKCIDCEHSSGNKDGKHICYQLGTIFWFKDILNQDIENIECEQYSPLIELGDLEYVEDCFDVIYPIEKLMKLDESNM